MYANTEAKQRKRKLTGDTTAKVAVYKARPKLAELAARFSEGFTEASAVWRASTLRRARAARMFSVLLLLCLHCVIHTAVAVCLASALVQSTSLSSHDFDL